MTKRQTISRDIWCDHCDHRYGTKISGHEGVGTCPNCGKPTLLVTCGVCESQSELSYINFEKDNWICPQCKEERGFSAETLTDYLAAQIISESPTTVERSWKTIIKFSLAPIILIFVLVGGLPNSFYYLFSPLLEMKSVRQTRTPTPFPSEYVEMYRQSAIDLTDSGHLLYVRHNDTKNAIYSMNMQNKSTQKLRLSDDIHYITMLTSFTNGFVFQAVTASSIDGTALYWMDKSGAIKRSENHQHVPPTFSPDGNRMIFSQMLDDQENSVGLYLVDLQDSSREKRLLWSGYSPTYAWSPDGEKVVFTNQEHLYSLTMDDLETVQLTSSAQFKYWLKWSPDSDSILYMVDQHLYVYDFDSQQSRQLTDFASISMQTPVWTPDGRYVVFSANFDGDFDLYAIDSSQENALPVRLFNTDVDEFYPAWQFSE